MERRKRFRIKLLGEPELAREMNFVYALSRLNDLTITAIQRLQMCLSDDPLRNFRVVQSLGTLFCFMEYIISYG
ncbi:hypothetical protein KIN20_037085 [Parelaphostrongylus tenuis]|uniref:Uncharacterized protein n=1 Tax=Parelaphostrongylus tenuis TaxID=148309 RepID=A0AAD5RE24_PARTN|nr:hypothetical protein KIN20_037085 [Parelaphostrongylus tenuis]